MITLVESLQPIVLFGRRRPKFMDICCWAPIILHLSSFLRFVPILGRRRVVYDRHADILLAKFSHDIHLGKRRPGVQSLLLGVDIILDMATGVHKVCTHCIRSLRPSGVVSRLAGGKSVLLPKTCVARYILLARFNACEIHSGRRRAMVHAKITYHAMTEGGRNTLSISLAKFLIFFLAGGGSVKDTISTAVAVTFWRCI